MTDQDFSSVFHGPGIRVWLNCTMGCCDMELQVMAEPPAIPYHQTTVEVLLQPRGNDGLAQGGPITVCQQTVTLQSVTGGQSSWGYYRLPSGFGAELAARCYLRIQPIPTGRASSTTNPTSHHPSDE